METEQQDHRRRGKGRPVSIKEHWKIVLDIKKGMNCSEAGRIHQRTAATCHSIYKKYQETGDVVDKPNAGAFKKKTDPDYVPLPPRGMAKPKAENKILKDVSTQTTLSWSELVRGSKAKPTISTAWIALRGLREKHLKEKWTANDRN